MARRSRLRATAAIVNNGSVQRSMVGSLTVVFPSAVTLSAGAITLYNTTTSASQTVSYSNPSSDGKTWLVTWSGAGIVGGSLPDGIYQLTVHDADVSGITLGSDVVFSFHRLFGDINGDGAVNSTDDAAFLAAYTSSTGSPAYDPAFDYSAVGTVNNTAAFQFSRRYGGTTYSYTSAAPVLSGPSATAALGATDISQWAGGANDMYYSGSNVIEERQSGSSGAWRQEVWGLGYVNSLIEQDTATAVDSGGVLPTSHFLQYALDTSFNGTGTLVGGAGSFDSVAIQPSNSDVVVAGVAGSDLFIVRYNANGAIDTTFGSSGVAFSESSPTFAKLALDSSGNIDVAVNSGSNVEVYQLSDTGSTNWSTTLTFATSVIPQGIALEPSGDIVVAGDSSSGTGIYLAGLNPSTGAVDTSFGSSGYVNAPLSGNPSGMSIALDSSGKILVAGSDGGDSSVVRFTSSGSLDTSFNSTGEATVSLGGTDTAYAIAPGPGGTIVAAGVAVISGSNDDALIRLTSSGSLDTSFNSTGKILGSTGSGTIRAILVQTNGEVLAGGDASSGTAQKVWMFTPAGAADTAFASGGTLTANSGATVYGWAVASGPTQRIVVAGSYGGDEALAAFAPASQRLYAEQSANYNVTSMVAPYGNVDQRYVYDPYGNMTVLSAAWTPRSDLFDTQVGFQGMWLDQASGLYHTANRDYSAALGRWMEADPSGYGEGADVYLFAGASPTNLVDADGLAGVRATAPPISKAKFLKQYGQGDKDTFADLDAKLLANSTAFEDAAAYAVGQEDQHYMKWNITFQNVTTPGFHTADSPKFKDAGRDVLANTYSAGFDLVVFTWEICTKGTAPGHLTATETQKVVQTPTGGKPQTLVDTKAQPTELIYGKTWYVAPLKNADGEFTDMLIYVDSPGIDAEQKPIFGHPAYAESNDIGQTVEVKSADDTVRSTYEFGVNLVMDTDGSIGGGDVPLPEHRGPSSEPS